MGYSVDDYLIANNEKVQQSIICKGIESLPQTLIFQSL